jgi:hypothetical protein
MDEAVAIANRVAPEHLELALADPDPWVAKDPPRGRHLHRSLHLGVARRLLRRAEPRAADFGQRPLLVAARRLRLPEAHQPDQGLAGRRADAGPHRLDAGAWRGSAGARQVGRVPAGTIDPETAPLTATHQQTKTARTSGRFFWVFRRSASPASAACCPLPGACWSRAAMDDGRGVQRPTRPLPVPARPERGQSGSGGRQALPGVWPVPSSRRSACSPARASSCCCWRCSTTLRQPAAGPIHAARHRRGRLRPALRDGLAHGHGDQGQAAFPAIYRVDRGGHRLAALADAGVMVAGCCCPAVPRLLETGRK